MKVDYIDHMGDDERVADSARVSFDKIASNYSKEQNDKLISFLARNGHFSPFTHPQLTLRYTIPIFVARQEFKHLVGFTRNEVSRRYVDDDPEFFVPDVWRSRPDGSVKQGSGDSFVDTMEMYGYTHKVSVSYQALIAHVEAVYRGMILSGVAPEQARMVLPQSMYTSYYITGSLAAFARMYNQRSDNHAQKEIQDLAEMVKDVVQPLYPVSWEALTS